MKDLRNFSSERTEGYRFLLRICECVCMCVCVCVCVCMLCEWNEYHQNSCKEDRWYIGSVLLLQVFHTKAGEVDFVE